jgi:hypothetical protein
MKIKMVETHRGSEDGFNSKRFEKNREYEVADALARQFVRNGWAVPQSAPATLESTLLGLARANVDFDRIFRPQPTRGNAPTNPATLVAKGEL